MGIFNNNKELATRVEELESENNKMCLLLCELVNQAYAGMNPFDRYPRGTTGLPEEWELESVGRRLKRAHKQYLDLAAYKEELSDAMKRTAKENKSLRSKLDEMAIHLHEVRSAFADYNSYKD